MQCRICNLNEESEKHLINCSEVVKKIGGEFNLNEANYLDIYSENIESQIKITRIFEKIMKIKIMSSDNDSI